MWLAVPRSGEVSKVLLGGEGLSGILKWWEYILYAAARVPVVEIEF